MLSRLCKKQIVMLCFPSSVTKWWIHCRTSWHANLTCATAKTSNGLRAETLRRTPGSVSATASVLTGDPTASVLLSALQANSTNHVGQGVKKRAPMWEKSVTLRTLKAVSVLMVK